MDEPLPLLPDHTAGVGRVCPRMVVRRDSKELRAAAPELAIQVLCAKQSRRVDANVGCKRRLGQGAHSVQRQVGNVGMKMMGRKYGHSSERGKLLRLASRSCLRGVADLLGPAVIVDHPAGGAARRPDAATARCRLSLGAVRSAGVCGIPGAG